MAMRVRTDETELAAEWLAIRDEIVRPQLDHLAGATPTGDNPETEEQ